MTATDRRPARARHRALTAAALAVPLLAATACSSTNFNAPTDQVYQPAQGTNDRDGEVDVLNALIVSETEGTGRFIAGLANNGDEDVTLTGVAGAGDDAAVQFGTDGGEAVVGPNGFLQLADEGAALISASGEAVAAGGYVTLTLTFDNGQETEMDVPVVSPGEDFADVELPDSTATPEG